MSTNQNNNLKL